MSIKYYPSTPFVQHRHFATPHSLQRNIKPMTRPERRALKDKVALEKGRLMQAR